MKKVPMRLGALALLLLVVSMCLTSLSMLSYADASADMRQAQKYAQTVKIRYDLERQGQEFLEQTEASGSEETVRTSFYEEGYELEIELQKTDDGYEIKQWKIRKVWDKPEKIDDLWEG